jgi:hypothetical protein
VAAAGVARCQEKPRKKVMGIGSFLDLDYPSLSETFLVQGRKVAMSTITDEEAARAGARSLALLGLVSVVLLILGIVVGLGKLGGGKVAAPVTPPPASTEAPATNP